MSDEDPRLVPLVQPQNRGCAVVSVLAATAVVAVLAVGAGWFFLSLDRPEAADFEAAPECAIGETEQLGELVPEYVGEFAEPVGSAQETFGEGWQCRWATPEGEGQHVPAFASMVVVAAPDPGGPETAADNLDSTVAGQDSQELADLGEEAHAWLQAGEFAAGCVGTRVSNLYLETCYGAAADYEAQRPADDEQLLEGAQVFARSVVDEL